MAASLGSSRASIRGWMLYPPCMVPRSLIASSGVKRGDLVVPLATAAKKPALTYAASSTPGGTRVDSSSLMKSSSPAGGASASCTSSATCFASSGFGTIPSALRSSTCLLYDSAKVDTERVCPPTRLRNSGGAPGKLTAPRITEAEEAAASAPLVAAASCPPAAPWRSAKDANWRSPAVAIRRHEASCRAVCLSRDIFQNL
mmetsp:Transcript_29766/g.65015  ORF Transcript_29766/g.65015 Transcript_29766/m.65015 type:complete len:201 (-) Transcript_29766:24-626(-)